MRTFLIPGDVSCAGIRAQSGIGTGQDTDRIGFDPHRQRRERETRIEVNSISWCARGAIGLLGGCCVLGHGCGDLLVASLVGVLVDGRAGDGGVTVALEELGWVAPA